MIMKKRTVGLLSSLIFLMAIGIYSCKQDQISKIGVPDNAMSTVEEKVEEVQPSSEHSHIVIIKGMQFIPQNLSVPAGDTIIWINKDIVAHNVTQDTARAWTSGEIAVGESWTLVPNEGFDYLCTLHPTMKASVSVTQ